MTGALTEQIDGVQLLVAAFFIFFAFLIWYLRREDKREGFPMVDIGWGRRPIEGFPAMPKPKHYVKLEGGMTAMPHRYGSSAVRANRLLRFPGAPLVPIGDPLTAEVGPGAYPLREDEPFLMHGHPQVVPLRVAPAWSVVRGDIDPRGMPVVDTRGTLAGHVTEIWVDRSVKILRYLEVALAAPNPERHVLLPIYYADISRHRGTIRVRALLAHQFAAVPALAHPDQITAREEDMVNAFYSNGLMFSRTTASVVLTPRTNAGSEL